MLGKFLCTQLGHTYPVELHTSALGCTTFKKCKRCGHEEILQTVHDYETIPPRSDTNPPCQEIVRCRRCRQIRETKTMHDFEEMTPGSNAHPCQVVKRCKRCGGNPSEMEYRHNYQPTGKKISTETRTSETTYSVEKCTVCGAETQKQIAFNWTDW